MPPIGWVELLVLAVIALLVIGPRDLPMFLRAAGRMGRTVKGMAGEVRESIDELADEAELTELRKQVTPARDLNPARKIRTEIDKAKSDVTSAFNPLAEKPASPRMSHGASPAQKPVETVAPAETVNPKDDQSPPEPAPKILAAS